MIIYLFLFYTVTLGAAQSKRPCHRYASCDACQRSLDCFWHGDGLCRSDCWPFLGCLRESCEVCEASKTVGYNDCDIRCGDGAFGCHPVCTCPYNFQVYDGPSRLCLNRPSISMAFNLAAYYQQVATPFDKIPTSPAQVGADTDMSEKWVVKTKAMNFLKSVGDVFQKKKPGWAIDEGNLQTTMFWATDENGGRKQIFDDMVTAFCLSEHHKGYNGLISATRYWDALMRRRQFRYLKEACGKTCSDVKGSAWTEFLAQGVPGLVPLAKKASFYEDGDDISVLLENQKQRNRRFHTQF